MKNFSHPLGLELATGENAFIVFNLSALSDWVIDN
jgi:hypothetical protein